MLISGLQPFTTIDYPEKLACILFTAGCNFRCAYCHNSEFVLPEKLKELRDSFIDHDAAMSFLHKRRGLLDAVVISGGEPTMMPDLLDWMHRIKEMGFLVKLDTNGTHPDIVRRAIDSGIVDYIAMDIKSPLSKYSELAQVDVKTEELEKSISIIKNAGIDYEFRSVLIKGFHTLEDIESMAKLAEGAKTYRLLEFRPAQTLCPAFALMNAFGEGEMRDIKGIVSEYVERVIA